MDFELLALAKEIARISSLGLYSISICISSDTKLLLGELDPFGCEFGFDLSCCVTVSDFVHSVTLR